MTWVKLCGMTRREDVEMAVEVGADAVGFVVYESSPRCIPIGSVEALAEGVDIERFLVTVDAEPSWLVRTARAVGVSGVQPHGIHAVEAASAALAEGLGVLFPVAVLPEAAPDLSRVPTGAHPLLDTGGTGLYGGTGQVFDWSVVPKDREVVLAGGLRPDNVVEAVAASGAWGVDVASGVEREPGIKDHVAMRRFVEAVK